MDIPLKVFIAFYLGLGIILFGLVAHRDKKLTGWQLYHKKDTVAFMVFVTLVTYAVWPLFIWVRYSHVMEAIANEKARQAEIKRYQEQASLLRNRTKRR